jgi:spermidine synthase
LPPLDSGMDIDPRPVVVDRRQTARGEFVLRRSADRFEIIANGTFLIDSSDGRSERALVREGIGGRPGVRVLLGGLGLGISLDECLRGDVREVVVVEIEPVVAEWGRTHLRPLALRGLDDPRVRLEVADLRDAIPRLGGGFDAICLDLDNGPGWTVHAENAELYTGAGIDRLRALLAPGGRLAVWAAAEDAGFAARLGDRFPEVRAVSIPVARGPDDVVYLAALRS